MTAQTAVPAVEMAHAVASYQAVLFTLRRFDDATAKEPSRLPGWSRAHVVAHLARNADSHSRLLEAAMRSELVTQYPGGAEGRAHEIELSSRHGAAEVLDDFQRSSEALFAIWERMPRDAWDAPTRFQEGSRAARDTVWARWRELEVHHADLDLGFEPTHWPRGFVQLALPRLMAGLPQRRAQRAAVRPATWLLDCGRAGASWTVVVDLDGTDVRSPDGTEHHDVAVKGPEWALLFWLYGRASLRDLDLTVTGDVDLAATLPGIHPYP